MDNGYLREFLHTVNREGFVQTLQHVKSTILDTAFDLQYGTNTVLWEKLGDLDIPSKNRDRGVDYHPTRTRPFRHLMDHLNIPQDNVFVDFGCGKGRTLLLAMEYGFQRVVGIDFSKRLCDIAQRNIAIYRKKSMCRSKTEIILSDVVNYSIKDDESIFYIFNPFDRVVLKKVLLNIRWSLELNSRKIWLIYYNPIWCDVIAEQKPFLSKKGEFDAEGHQIFVYENTGA